ncbi:VWA domain-containing protein [Streptomyces sp. NPDC002187]|uniref:VWA domain-containing protein n=1 Tax=Streptomyces sp. NPDC002187 TaxID=3364637 RepID=UPI0036BE5FBB
MEDDAGSSAARADGVLTGAVEPPTSIQIHGARPPGSAVSAGRALLRTAAVLGSALLLAGLLSPGAGAAPDRPPAAAPPAASDDPINYAVAVDESASLDPGDIDREKDAVSAIAVGEPSPKSRMAVFGFASADTADQSPIHEVCPVTELDVAGRERISECASELRRRERDEGSGTDFISAVRQGVARLTEAPGPDVPRVLFLLTDGKLDVEDSYTYRDLDTASRTDAVKRDLRRALKEARDAKVQIWPLGFGSDIDLDALRALAAGGYQTGCKDIPEAEPKAAVVPRAEDVGEALETAFSAARCLYREPGDSGRPPTDLKVRVSPLAAVGTIVVSKGDPEVTATYYDPNGKKISQSGPELEFSGRDRAVESLRITRPLAGEWRVHLDAPEGHRDRLARISVLWRGEIRSSISLEKPSPRPGEKTAVRVQLLTRDSVKLEERDLRGISVAGKLTGEGFGQVAIGLADDGDGADTRANDGEFSGTVTVPKKATGALMFSSTVEAVGLSPDNRPYPTRIAPPTVTFDALLGVPSATVHPGGRVRGYVAVSNRDSTERTVRLALADAQGTGLTISPAQVTVRPGTSRNVDFTLDVGSAAELGVPVTDSGLVLGGKVVVAEDDAVLDDASLDITVTPRPSDAEVFWDKWWPVIIIGTALFAVLLALLLSRRRLRRWQIAPGGLVLELRDAANRTLGEHKAKAGRGSWYEFELVDAATDSPRIQRRPGGAYAVRRSPDGGAVLRSRGQADRTLRHGDSMTIADGLTLHVAEGTGRRPARPGRSAVSARRAGTGRPERGSDKGGGRAGTTAGDPGSQTSPYPSGVPGGTYHEDL